MGTTLIGGRGKTAESTGPEQIGSRQRKGEINNNNFIKIRDDQGRKSLMDDHQGKKKKKVVRETVEKAIISIGEHFRE